MIGNYLMYATGGLALVYVLVILLTHRRSKDIREWMVGATAGLDFAQIAHVHLFTIAVVFWVLTSGGIAFGKVSAATLALLLSAAILGATAFVGPLSVNHTLVLQLMGLAVSAALIGVKASPGAIRRMAWGLLAVTLFSASWAILQKFGFLPIRQLKSVEGAGRVNGIYLEPDWLGLFCAVGIVTTLRLDLPSRRKVGFLSILSLALIFSLARGSVIALVVVGVVATLGNLMAKRDIALRSRNRQVLAVLAGLVTVALVVSPSLSGRLVDRFQKGFTNSSEDAGARARSQQIRSLDLLAQNAPWYGDGLSASGRVEVSGTINYGNIISSHAVSTNWILGWWIDGKYLALPLIALFLMLVLRYAKTLGGQLLLVVLVTSLVTDAVMLPITWFSIGLCLANTFTGMAGARNAQADRKTPALRLVTARG